MIETELHIDAAHPALAGHFPGRPIVPGVVLLAEAMRAIESREGADFALRHRLASVKFLKPVGPDARLALRVDFAADSRIAFTLSERGQPVASGSFARIEPRQERKGRAQPACERA